jgi:hypothetical protein
MRHSFKAIQLIHKVLSEVKNERLIAFRQTRSSHAMDDLNSAMDRGGPMMPGDWA